jgi:mono/diheme cytochrome c family protein
VIRQLAIILAATPLCVAAQDNGTTAPSAAQRWAPGSYAEIQAVRGDSLVQIHCASCHEPSFHSDEQFRFNWFGRPLYELFKTLKTTMPEDNIGGLTDDEYTRVVAYILRLNGFPAGVDSLRADSLEMKLMIFAPPPTDSVTKDTLDLKRDTAAVAPDTARRKRR